MLPYLAGWVAERGRFDEAIKRCPVSQLWQLSTRSFGFQKPVARPRGAAAVAVALSAAGSATRQNGFADMRIPPDRKGRTDRFGSTQTTNTECTPRSVVSSGLRAFQVSRF